MAQRINQLSTSSISFFLNARNLNSGKIHLAARLTLQHPGCVAHFIQKRPPDKWRESGLLRFHRIAELDESSCCPIGATALRLDRNLGVIIERKLQSGEVAT